MKTSYLFPVIEIMSLTADEDLLTTSVSDNPGVGDEDEWSEE